MIELNVLENELIPLETFMPTGGGGAVINNQNKTVTPTLAQQNVTADAGYTGLGTVTVEAMPSGEIAEVGALVNKNTSTHTATITPYAIVEEAGYVEEGETQGTSETVTASELVSGTKSITENGTEDVTNYASVNVNVPNSYDASDEGKVVDNGALVAQGSATYTENGTYDTTLVDDVTVNVSSSGGISVDDIAQNLEPSGAVTLSVTTIKKYAFHYKPISSIFAPTAQYIEEGAFSGTMITSISDANFPSYKGSSASNARVIAFKMMNELLTIRLSGELALDDGSGFMQTHNKLTHAEFPNATAVDVGNAGFRYNPLLEFVDLGRSKSIGTNCFNGATTLRTLVLRDTSHVTKLNGWTSAILGGIYSNPTESTIYVPQALISSYQTATNWSTGYAQGLTFTAIEGTEHETKFSDGTPILTT